MQNKLCGFLISIVILFSPLALHAEDLDPLKNIDRIKKEQKRLKQLDDLEKELEKETSSDLSKKYKKVQNAKCFAIKKIVFTGVESLKRSIVKDLKKPFLHRCININDVRVLVRNITSAYVDKGFSTARAYIPAQDLSLGKLKINVVEGIVEKITVNEDKFRDRMLERFAFPGLEEEILNIKDLEQGLDQINRSSYSNATMKLYPGSKAGQSNIKINHKPEHMFMASIGYDNFGSEAVGENRLRASLSKDNLFGIGDNWSMSYIGNNNNNNTVISNASFIYGNWTLSGTHAYSKFKYDLSADNFLEGDSTSVDAKLERVVYRATKGVTSAYSIIDYRESGRLFNGDTILVSPKLSALRLGLEQTFRSKIGAWSFNSEYSRGLTSFGATKDEGKVAANTSHAQFEKVTSGITYFNSIPVKGFGIRLYSVLEAQYAFDTLYGAEQLTTGDNSTVRGFKNTSISADSGFYHRNEISLQMPHLKSLNKAPYVRNAVAKMQPYIFYDYSILKPKNSKEEGHMAGTGFGMRYYGNSLTLDATYSKALNITNQLNGIDNLEEADAVYLQATYNFGIL